MIGRNVKIAVASLLLVSCSPTGSQSDPAYERVLRTGTITAGYVNYPPSFIVDPNTSSFSGISHDILNQAAREMGLEVNYNEELAFGSVIEAVNSGRSDMIGTGIWPNASRGLRAAFSNPLFYSPVYAYVRIDDDRFDDEEFLSQMNFRISTIDGEMSSIIATTDYPNAERIELTQMTSPAQMLLEIAANKADISFLEPSTADAYIAQNPGQIRRVDSMGPIRLFPNAFMFSHDSPKLRAAMDLAIADLQRSGAISRILDQYDPDEVLYVRVATTRAH